MVDDAEQKNEGQLPNNLAKITLLHGQTIRKETPNGPDTPNQENMDATYSNSPASGNVNEDGSPSSPITKFDPFAPGPADMERAPRRNVVRITRNCKSHRLVFEDPDDSSMKQNQEGGVEPMSEEQQMAENLYQNLLESVIAKTTEVFFAENPTVNEVSFMSPRHTMLIQGRDACPGAPCKKPSPARTENTDTIIRRKLEF